MLSLLQRIPPVWIALILGGFGASLYLRYLTPKSPENRAVRERIFTIVMIDILFSRFSGLILHPSSNIGQDLLSLLSGASSSGWLVGLVASVLYTFLSLWRAKHLSYKMFALLAGATTSGGLVYFASQAFTDLNPFRTEDIFRILGCLILLWLIRKNRTQLMNHPQWLWTGFGLMLLLTSTYVPHVSRVLLFSTPQWIFISTMVIAIIAEAKQDFVTLVILGVQNEIQKPDRAKNETATLYEKDTEIERQD